MRLSIARCSSLLCISAALFSSPAVHALTCADLDGASVYSQEAQPEYLGFFGSEYAAESIYNEFGTFGSEYSASSIRNPYGTYGSPYGMYSANNPYASTPPIIVKGDQALAYLTENEFLSSGISLAEIDATCAFHATRPGGGGVTEPVANPNQRGISGTWANPATAGQGLVVEVAPDYFSQGSGLLFAGWYTYDSGSNGSKRWYTLQGTASASSGIAEADIYLTHGGRFDSLQATTTTKVGHAAIQFADCGKGLMVFNFTDGSGRSGVIPIMRLLPNIDCSQSGSVGQQPGSQLLSGTWADASENSGQGIVWEANPAVPVLFAGWYTFGAHAEAGSGESGLTWYTLQAPILPDGSIPGSFGIYETTGGTFNGAATTATTQVGTATLTFHSCTSASMNYSFSDGQNAGMSGTLNLVRLMPSPAGCG